MRRIFKVITSVLLAGVLGASAAGCSGRNGKGYKLYESVANKEADTSFAFDTDLDDWREIYPLSVGGKTYYVAANGNDNNDGLTEASPITIGKVSSLDLGAGDSVLFKKGDKFKSALIINNKSGDDGNPITFASYGAGDKKPIIELGNNPVVFSLCSNIVFRDMEISVIGKSYSQAALTGIDFQYSYVGANKYKNIYIVNNDVHADGYEKNVFGIAVSSLERDAKTSPDKAISNVYIYRNTVYNLGRSGIHTSGWLTNEKLNQNNTLWNLYNNVFVNENTVYDVGNIGIYVVACTNSTINRNLVYRTGMRSASENAEGECGIMALGADTMDIMYNVSYDNRNAGTAYDSMAIDIDWNTTNINVQYNHTYDNMGSGIGTMACQNSYIRHNRVENNRCETNQVAQIQVSDFTSRYACVEDDMHAVKNVKVSENMVIGTPKGKKMFKAQKFNGDDNWSDNVFENNRVVYTGDEEITWVEVDASIPWYKFANNKYYGKGTTFVCFDNTDLLDINYGEGAEPYVFNKDKKFSAWAKRDLGATYKKLTQTAPSKPTNVTAKFEDGKLKLNWKKSLGDIWHYNVYAVGENEDVSYLNLLGWAFDASFEYQPQFKDDFYIVIQPESNQGVYGEALKIKIELN